MAWRLSHNPATPQYQGVVRMTGHGARWTEYAVRYGYEKTAPDWRGAFASLWDQINGKRAPWASNPWVWRVAFARVTP